MIRKTIELINSKESNKKNKVGTINGNKAKIQEYGPTTELNKIMQAFDSLQNAK